VPDTPYLESEAILAASEGDEDRLDWLLADMLPSELAELKRAAQHLAQECGIKITDKRAAMVAHRKANP
jgi:uncharacterized protein (UPF0210 family)